MSLRRGIRHFGGALIVLLVTSLHGLAANPPVVTALGDYQADLHTPSRLAVDPDARLYISEPDLGQVIVADAFGHVEEILTGFATPLGLAIDASGNIYLGEQGAGSVSVFDSQWNLLYQLGQGDGEFQLPNHIATDPSDSGTVYIADSLAGQIKVYTSGILTLAFGTEGTNALDFPTGVFITTNQELFVVDQNNDRIQVYNRDGLFLRMFALVPSSPPPGGRSQGITVDSAGRVYVADTLQGVIHVFDSQGNLLTTLGTYGNGLGQLKSPAGLALDRYNRLFVASANNNRVEIMGLDAFTHFTSSQGDFGAEWRSTVVFSVITGGDGPFTYQWQRNGENLSDNGIVSGARSTTLTLTGVTLEDSGSYSVVISSPAGVMNGPGTTLQVNRSRTPLGTLIMVF